MIGERSLLSLSLPFPSCNHLLLAYAASFVHIHTRLNTMIQGEVSDCDHTIIPPIALYCLAIASITVTRNNKKIKERINQRASAVQGGKHRFQSYLCGTRNTWRGDAAELSAPPPVKEHTAIAIKSVRVCIIIPTHHSYR